MSKGLLIAGVILILAGSFVYLYVYFFGSGLLAILLLVAGFALAIMSAVRRERIGMPMDYYSSGSEIKRQGETMRQGETIRGGETMFEGIVVGKSYEVDGKKGYGYTPGGYSMQYKHAIRIKLSDSEGNPLGIREAIFEPKDNFRALHDGDRVYIRGKWTKEGRVKVKEAFNKTLGTKITRRSRFGGVKKIVAIVVTVIVIFALLIIFLLIIGRGMSGFL